MMADAIVPAGSSAVLIGVSAYEYAGLPPIRAARNSLNAMRSLLADPALCAWPDGQIRVIANPISAGDLAAQIADLAAATTGVLLLFYVGHGVLSASGDLCLTVTSTDPDRPERTGLPWNTVADVLRGSPAHTRLSILDCCFAGQATGGPAGDGDPGVAPAGLTDIEGGYTLAATTHDDSAHVPHPEQQDDACTSFTGELRDLITHGIPGRPPWLTFGDIYPALCGRLTARGLPAPSQRGTGTAREFVFTANAAVPGRPLQRPVAAGSLGARAVATPNPAPATPNPAPAAPPSRAEPGRSQPGRAEPGRAEPGQPGPSRHDRLVTEALRAAQSIPESDAKARALVAVARAVALTNPDRAARLMTDAHRVAQSISDPGEQASALASIAGPLAVSDAGTAETVAQSIPDVPWKAAALAGVAGTLAATDAERAGRLIADAERAAQSVTDTDRKATALAAVTGALAVIDSDRGEQVAQAIAAAERKAPALAALAQAVTAGDPDRAERLIADAERIARPIPGASARAPALAAVAMALAAFDADRAARLVGDAERSAQSIPGMDRKASALAAVAAAMAAVDPAHAERLARSISAAPWRATALAAVAAKSVMLPPVQAS